MFAPVSTGLLSETVIVKQTFPRSLRATTRSPPCALAMFLEIASPRPVPWGFVVKKGSNILERAALEIGSPVFSTSSSKVSIEIRRLLTATRPRLVWHQVR